MVGMKDVMELVSDSVFCYAKPSGQGFLRKSECSCYHKGEKCCNAFKEQEDFHKTYKELESQGFTRQEILSSFEKKLEGKESDWFQQNVVK